MNKYINANILMQDIERSRASNNHNNAIAFQTHNAEHRHFIKMVLDQPTVDVVEVVRCEHCKFYRPFEQVEDFDGKCIIHGIEIDKEFYCQYGVKKAE